jgi:TadE-like protein
MTPSHRVRARPAQWRPAAARSDRVGPAGRGQALAEFALVIPMLLLILLTVADFGRYFAASISIESMARTSAEIAAQEYVQEEAASLSPKQYGLIHKLAWQSVCDEGHDLPNATPGSGGGECSGLPTLVCVHDTIDPICGTTYNGAGGVPAQCNGLQPGAAPTPTLDSQAHNYVEVRVCYRFNSFFDFTIPFFDISLSPLSGNFYIERTRQFTVADY